MKKLNSFVVLSVSCLMATGIAACSNPAPAPHTHTYSDLHEKVDATCHSEGMEAYYSCTGCDKFFDEEKNEVTFEDLKIDMLPHHGVRVEAVNATCTQEGHLEYWACDGGCEKIFSDANCTTETTMDAVRTQKIPHAMRKIDGTPETCTSEGIKDAWMCSSCGDYFEDEAGTVKIGDQVAYLAWTLAGGKIPAHAHDTTLVPGEASTCSTNGFKDAYRCKECGDYFENQAGTNKIGNAEAYALWKLNEGKLPLDTEIHDLVKVDGAAPSCTRAGRQDAWFCNDCERYFSDSEGKNEIGNEAAYLLWIAEGGAGYIPLAEHVFDVVYGIESSCTEHGYKDACQCKYCSDYFEFDEGHARIGDAAAYAAWKTNPNGGQLPLAEHDVDLVPGTPSTCLVEGFADAYKCGDCNNYFYKNEEQVLVLIGNEAQYDSWKTGEGKLPLAPHTGTLVPGEAPTCTDSGFRDAYACSVCGDYFEDAECLVEIGNAEAYQTWITTGDGYLEPNGHDMELVEGLEETCEANGYKDAYYCEECETYFEDELGVTEIGDEDAYDAWIAVGGEGFIPMHPHDGSKVEGKAKDVCKTDGYLDAWKCDECKNYFSDEDFENKIGDAEAYAAWKVGDGKIAKDPHTPGTLIPEIDAHREDDGMKAHSNCDVCDCLLDAEGNETTEDELKIPSRLYEFTANADRTIRLDRNYSMTDTLVLDIKNKGTEGQNVRFMIFDPETSPEWKDTIGYFKVTQTGIEGNYEGVKTDVTDDGFVRITIDLSNVDERLVSGNPTVITTIYLDFRWSDAPGVLEIAPSFEGHDYGDLIPEVDAVRDTAGMKAHYECSECGHFFDEHKNPVSESDLVIPSRKHALTAGNDANFVLPKAYDSTIGSSDVLVIDLNIDDDKNLFKFQLYDGHDWDNTFGYYDIYGSSNGDLYSGISAVQFCGFTRVTINFGDLTMNGTRPETITNIYFWGVKCTATGWIDIAPAADTKNCTLGALIPATDANRDVPAYAAHYECEDCGAWFNEDKIRVNKEDLTFPNAISEVGAKGKQAIEWKFSKPKGAENPYGLSPVKAEGKIDICDIQFDMTEVVTDHSEYGVKLYDTWDTYYFFWFYSDGRVEVDGGASSRGVKSASQVGVTYSKLDDGWTRVTIDFDYLKTQEQYRSDVDKKASFDEINMILDINANGNPTYGKVEWFPTCYHKVTTRGQLVAGGTQTSFTNFSKLNPTDQFEVDLKFVDATVTRIVLYRDWKDVKFLNWQGNYVTKDIKVKCDGTLVDQREGANVFKVKNNDGSDTGYYRLVVNLSVFLGDGVYSDDGYKEVDYINRFCIESATDGSLYVDVKTNADVVMDPFVMFYGNESSDTKIELRGLNYIDIQDGEGNFLTDKFISFDVRATGSGKVKFSIQDNEWHNCGNITLTFTDGALTDKIMQGSGCGGLNPGGTAAGNYWPTITDNGDGTYNVKISIAKLNGDGWINARYLGFFYGDGLIANGVTSFGINTGSFKVVDA